MFSVLHIKQYYKYKINGLQKTSKIQIKYTQQLAII